MQHPALCRLGSCLLPLLALTAGACSGSDDDGAETTESVSGTVTAVWSDYCIATFDDDVKLRDVFDEPTFTAKAGEAYLISSLDSMFGDEATLLFLTPDGPADFTVSTAEGEQPFTTDCDATTAVTSYGVFTDVTVYATEDLEQSICELSAGDVASANGATGYVIATSAWSGPQVYEVFLGGFADGCGGAESGFVEVPETTVWGGTTWLVPFATVMGPG